MEVKDYQGHKYRRISNSNSNNNERLETDKKGNEEEDDEVKRRSNGSSGGGVVVVGSGMGGGLDFRSGRLCGWPSSRIVRVSRASGGKDRHSKVWTSKGLRDRRVRLSVNTAIQFYDLQDRLGYDQPSKAVEWLLKAAASSISDLPSINTSFPESPKLEQTIPKPDPKYSTQLAKPGCSDNSDENSKGSGELSLSRSESRFKARERARERSAREKDKEILDETNIFHQDRLNTQVNQNSASFTELLTNGMNGNNDTSSNTPKIYSSSMDYFSSNLGNPLQQSMFTFSGDHHNHHQEPPHQFSFGENNGGNSNDYNLNFTISSSASGLDGYSRGTLQSNSSAPSILPHNQRFPFIDGSQLTFFIGAAAPPVENHHHQQQQQILPGLDARLQLYSDQKGKGKD